MCRRLREREKARLWLVREGVAEAGESLMPSLVMLCFKGHNLIIENYNEIS